MNVGRKLRRGLCAALAMLLLVPAMALGAEPLSADAKQRVRGQLVMYLDSTLSYLNGEPTLITEGVAPRKAEGSVYVPVRYAAEFAGYAVEWSGDRAVLTGPEGKTIELREGLKEIAVNGQAKSLEAPILVVEQRMIAPIEPFAAALGLGNVVLKQGLIAIGAEAGLLDPKQDEAIVGELLDLFAKPLPIKEVTASGHDGNIPANTVDSNLDTRWSAEGDGEWIQYDLGEAVNVGYVGIAFYNGDVRYSTFDLHTSSDGTNWTVSYEGRSSGTGADIETFDIEDASIRYVKLVGHGNSSNAWNSLTEFQVYAPNEHGLPVRSTGAAAAEAPDATPYTEPGLVNPDGTPHAVHEPNPVTGSTLNVLDYGADPADNGRDDAAAIRAAIQAAKEGDEVYLPNGTYNLLTTIENDENTHLELKSGVNIRGESQSGTVLVASVEGRSTKAIKSFAKQNVHISRITLTSDWEGQYSSDTKQKNPDVGGPQYLLYIADSGGKPSRFITVEEMTFEKFERMAVRIEESSDIVVRGSTFRNATDVAGGGAGYGVSIQGMPKTDRLGYANDTYFNVVEDSTFEGPYIRHGALIQYYAHNNVIRNNTFAATALDAIDLHGEDEYLNEIVGNEIRDVLTGGGIGVGNTGGSAPTNHDASGPGNYIHDNKISNSREGIKVYMGSPDTRIEDNVITASTIDNSTGILLLNAPGTIVKDNRIEGNEAAGFWGIKLEHDEGDTRTEDLAGRGDPRDITIIDNRITGNANGVYIGETAAGIVLEDNRIENNLNEDLVVLGEVVEPIDWTQAVPVGASADSYVYNKEPDANFGSADKYNLKRSGSGSTSRIGYFKFEVNAPEAISRAIFKLSAKLTDSNDEGAELLYDVYGLTGDAWTEDAINWTNSTNHASDVADVEGEGDTAVHLGTITMSEKIVKDYTLDVTGFVRQQTDGIVTLMVIDTLGQNGNVNVYSKERSNEEERPVLYLFE